MRDVKNRIGGLHRYLVPTASTARASLLEAPANWREQEIMDKAGRNSPCPCGSGKKYKRCWEQKEAELQRRELPSGRFCENSSPAPGELDLPSSVKSDVVGCTPT